jgi:N-acetyl-beta-hexosaminidase
MGGDEVALDCWAANPLLQAYMRAHNMTNATGLDPRQLLNEWQQAVFGDCAADGRAPMVWQEIFEHNVTIPANGIVDIWKGFDVATLQAATAAGHRVALSGPWYLASAQPEGVCSSPIDI